MTILKIDLKNGLIEVQGEEAFVKEVYSDYKNSLAVINEEESVAGDSKVVKKDVSNGASVIVSQKKVKTAKAGGSRKETHSLVGDLQLSPKGKKSLRQFFAEKAPQSAMEMNTVFVYFLQKELDVKNITVDHIYTCYKDTSTKVPGALTQSLKDTSHRKGWIHTGDMNNIYVTTIGENTVEHDLPKGKKEDK